MVDYKYGSPWSRSELVLALHLYCQIPFGQTTSRNPEVIRLAKFLGRTPSSVARKLGNFGAFDLTLAARGVTGLTNFSKADQGIWNEFYGHWDRLVEESEKLLQVKPADALLDAGQDEDSIISRPTGPTQMARLVQTRLAQSFFRRSVLACYRNTCCICGLDLLPLLVASHIVPWAAREEARTDPQNGLCLCALHDRAFDRGLLTITTNLTVEVSPLVDISNSWFTTTTLKEFSGGKITLPNRFIPRKDYLLWHSDNVFQR